MKSHGKEDGRFSGAFVRKATTEQTSIIPVFRPCLKISRGAHGHCFTALQPTPYSPRRYATNSMQIILPKDSVCSVVYLQLKHAWFGTVNVKPSSPIARSISLEKHHRPTTYFDCVLPLMRDLTTLFLLSTSLAAFFYDDEGPMGALRNYRR